ncbi:MAG: hypothetical protein K9N38_03850 [Candidatus Marinimicrobia bacterium]|nr:hypothetical protein [Candidatus Neomarinimicrobiota bacterium]MCF7850558.1 hypothetical protein [Candidatus Neomarinimicrobiota bacterium]
MSRLNEFLDQVTGGSLSLPLDISGIEDECKQIDSHSELMVLLEQFCRINTIPIDELLWWIEGHYQGDATSGITGLVTDLHTNELRILDILESFELYRHARIEESSLTWLLQKDLDLLDTESRLSITEELVTKYSELLPTEVTDLPHDLLSLHLEDLIHSIIHLRQSPYVQTNLDKFLEPHVTS